MCAMNTFWINQRNWCNPWPLIRQTRFYKIQFSSLKTWNKDRIRIIHLLSFGVADQMNSTKQYGAEQPLQRSTKRNLINIFMYFAARKFCNNETII